VPFAARFKAEPAFPVRYNTFVSFENIQAGREARFARYKYFKFRVLHFLNFDFDLVLTFYSPLPLEMRLQSVIGGLAAFLGVTSAASLGNGNNGNGNGDKGKSPTKKTGPFLLTLNGTEHVIGNDIWNITIGPIYGTKLFYKNKDIVGNAVGHYVSYSTFPSEHTPQILIHLSFPFPR